MIYLENVAVFCKQHRESEWYDEKYEEDRIGKNKILF